MLEQSLLVHNETLTLTKQVRSWLSANRLFLSYCKLKLTRLFSISEKQNSWKITSRLMIDHFSKAERTPAKIFWKHYVLICWYHRVRYHDRFVWHFEPINLLLGVKAIYLCILLNNYFVRVVILGIKWFLNLLSFLVYILVFVTSFTLK